MLDIEAGPYLVFQMAKVASRSWVKLLNEAFPSATVGHFHSVSRHSLTRIDDIISAHGARQTIKHLTLPRLGRPPAHIAPFLTNNTWSGPPAKIIAGVRDPIARAASVVGFLSNRLGYTRYGVTIRDGGTAETMCRLFARALETAQKGHASDDTLVTVLGHAMTDYDRWFGAELAPAFGMDIAGASFDRDSRCLRMTGQHELFVYRVEDLMGTSARTRLLQSASEFLGRKVTVFPDDEVSKEGRYRKLYSEFVRRLSLTDAEISWFYDNATARKFYSVEEIAGFKARWRRS
jgi:hypothetical protein